MFSTVSSVFNQDSGWCVPTLTAAQNINNAGTDPVWGTALLHRLPNGYRCG